MKIGVLRERKAGEKRVAIIPSTVSALTKKGLFFCHTKKCWSSIKLLR